jgi:hypothetical protein
MITQHQMTRPGTHAFRIAEQAINEVKYGLDRFCYLVLSADTTHHTRLTTQHKAKPPMICITC